MYVVLLIAMCSVAGLHVYMLFISISAHVVLLISVYSVGDLHTYVMLLISIFGNVDLQIM
jgi:hypothetical protein